MSADVGGASSNASGGGNKKDHNTIHEDEIRRQLIKNELEWARNWERKWGFMKDPYGKTKKLSPLTPNAKDAPTQTQFASGLPTKSTYLVDESTYDFAKPVDRQIRDNNSNHQQQQPQQKTESDNPAVFGPDKMKSFYLLTHQIKKLQTIGGIPADKYTFPATRNNEIGWWIHQNQLKKTATQQSPGTLIDAKIGRWARGQGNVYKWWGGGPN